MDCVWLLLYITIFLNKETKKDKNKFLYLLLTNILNNGQSLVKIKAIKNKIFTITLRKVLHKTFFNTPEIIKECSGSSMRK